ncbi:serine hydrolase domain-containing protein [Pseudoalteromonas luteoviolacea]|uniref:serine hydrolase domain-containing protein n=1 Tax=Pseudoalteromonas luteoviolacea TaxID=43657 RepID=UPI00163BC281|nr:serine hydrolase domain-containing protein [Pseudoalteromonas luteoviolacea]
MKLNRLNHKLLSAFVMFVLSACGSNDANNNQATAQQDTQPSHQQIAEKLDYQALIDGLVSSEVHGIILHVSTPDSSFTGSTGLANLTTQEPLQPDAVYHLASCGKVFTALLAVQLHEDGLLDLDHTLDNLLPIETVSQIQYADQITLRQMLNHSSGIYNYSDPNNPDSYIDFVMASYEQGVSNEDLTQFAYGKPAYFKPGEGIKYSNSNYTLAGMVMDRALGHSNAFAMRDKIIDRLALSNTFSVGIENQVAQLTPGYEKQDDSFINTGPILSKVSASSTPVASTVGELSSLTRRIFKDETWLSPAVRDELVGNKSRVKVSDTQDYVLGLWREQINGHTVYHHNGGNHGYISNNLYIPELDVSVVYFLNCGLSEACQNAFYTIENEVMASIVGER